METRRGFERIVLPGRSLDLLSRIFIVFSILTLSPLPYTLTPPVYAQTELGSMDDLAVFGVDGTALDPDVEIKGFAVFGSTQAAYTGAVAGPGNVVVNGALTVSSGAYILGDSTFPAAGSIFINDGSAGQALRKHAAGYLEWSSAGDNLGNHIAASTLQMGNYGVNSSSDVTAARYQINGNTVLAVLSGAGSFGVGIDAGMASAGDHNVFLGHNAGYSGTTGADNALLGYKAGFYTQTGSANAVFGASAGLGTLNNSFSSATIMGYQAGYSLTTGDRNVLLGYQAGYGITSGAGNIIIGNAQAPSSPDAATELNIGGVLYGSLSAGTIGISTRSPQAALDVVSTGSTAGHYAQLWRDSGGAIVSSLSATGVMMAVKFIGDGSELSGISAGGAADNLGNHIATTTLDMAGFPIVNISSAQIAGTGVGGADALFQIAGSTMAVLNNGNVGIGTASPGAKLEVAGQIKITGGSPAAGYVLTSDAGGLATWSNPAAAGGMPPGAVMFSTGAACPSGWSELTAAQGRYIVGLPSGGTLAGTIGTALADMENREVGQHTHTTTVVSHSHTCNNRIQSGYINSGTGNNRYYISGTEASGLKVSGITISNAGTVAGTNAPYMQVVLCQKD